MLCFLSETLESISNMKVKMLSCLTMKIKTHHRGGRVFTSSESLINRGTQQHKTAARTTPSWHPPPSLVVFTLGPEAAE